MVSFVSYSKILGLVLILLTSFIQSFYSYNNSHSLSTSAYGIPEIKKRFVELSDNRTGNSIGWNPDGKNVQFNITEPNAKNNSIITTNVNTVPASSLRIGTTGTGNELVLSEIQPGKVFVIPDLRSSIFELDTASNILSSTNIPVNNLFPIHVSNVDSNNIYLCCQKSKILVINLPTQNITGYIDIGKGATGSMFGPYTNKVYIPDWSVNGVKVINRTTNTVTNSIFTGFRPTIVGFEDPHKLYVLNSYFESGTNGTVSVINDTSKFVSDNIEVGNTPSDMLVDPIHHRIYVTNEGSPFVEKPNGTMTVIDSKLNKILGTLAVGRDPIQMIQSFRGSFENPTNIIYVLNRDSRDISVIDATSNKTIGKIMLPSSPNKMELNQNTNTIYVLHEDGVSIVNATSLKLIKTIPMTIARQMLLSNTNKIYVTHEGVNEKYFGDIISIIDGSTNSLIPTNLINCDVSSIADSKAFWLKCSGPPSKDASLKYSIETP
jgi:YVTN family beta-propeller protein